MARCRSKAFTLIELLIVVSIIALLVTMLVPTLGRTLEIARRATCRTNMKEIVRACQMYANSEVEQRKMSTPASLHGRVTSALPSMSPVAGTWYSPQSGATIGPSNRNCCWLLVRSRAASPALFICPSLDGFKAADPNDNGFNAGTTKTFGYGFISMVGRTFSAQGKSVFGDQWTKNIYTGLVLVGDLNPRFYNPDDLNSLNSGTLLSPANPNSPAHLSPSDVPDGQNVGTWDGSSRWIAANPDTLIAPTVATNTRALDKIYNGDLPPDTVDPNEPVRTGGDSSGQAWDINDIFLLN